MKRLVGWLLVVLLIGTALLYWGARSLVNDVIGIKPASSETTQPEITKDPVGLLVEVMPVRQQLLAQQVTAVGSLLAQHAVTIRAESSGRIHQVLFEEGSPVSQGMVLVQLDTDLLQAELQQAQAQLTLAQSRANRAQQLSKQGFISTQAQDEANSERAVAAAQVKIIQTKIDKSQIRAPFSGVLGLRNVSVGDYVANGTEIVNLASIDELQVDFRIPEQYLMQVAVGTPIHLRLDAQAGQEFTGKIKAINPVIDEQGRSVVLRAHISNGGGQLRPGQFARVVLDLNEIDALMVPETALSPSGQSQYVYRVIEGDKAERVEVQVGIRRDGWVQVTGLTPQDLILVSGLQKIQDGALVRYTLPEPLVHKTVPSES